MRVSRLGISSLVALAAFAAMNAARAADYSQPPPVYVQPPPSPPPAYDFAEGWYLRGDIGFSNQEVGSLFNEQYNAYDSVQTVDKSFDSAPFFGIGIGYNVNDWLRVDVTGEYRGKANFHGLDIGYVGGNYIPDRYTGSKSEWTFLLNGYVDLGTWYKITPFVGVGVGMSRNTISEFGDVGISTCPPALCTSDAYAAAASKWNFAWALHAGLAYKASRNLTIELAYRYINLGDATSGELVTYDGNVFPAMEFRDLTSHDVKLGLRFNLEGFAEPSTPVQYYPQPQTYVPPPAYAPVYAPPLRSKG